jgi:hypothetical protein
MPADLMLARRVVGSGTLTLALALGAAGCGSSGGAAKSTGPTGGPVRPPAPTAEVENALLVRIKTARSCLVRDGLPVSGGPVYPLQSPSSPDGELIVGSARAGAFIAFYTTATRAAQLEPLVARNAGGAAGQLERRGTVTVLWIRDPTERVRHAVLTCAFA